MMTSALRRLSSRFQPFDRGEIEMVGGSSSNRISGEGASTRASRRATAFAAREVCGSRRREDRAAPAHNGPGNGRRRVRGPLRHRRASWRGLRNQAPAANTDGRAGLAQNGCRGRARRCRPRSSAAVDCRSRCGQSADRSADDTTARRPYNSGVPPKVSRMSFNWISGGAMAFRFNSDLQTGASGAGCGGWSDRARTGTPSGRGRKGSGAAVTRRRSANRLIRLRTRQRHPDRLFP